MRIALCGGQPPSTGGATAVALFPSVGTSLAARWGAVLRRWLRLDEGPPPDGRARIRHFDVFTQPREWGRCREAGWYHLSRARRALDREDWDEAEYEARRALEWDDTRPANFLALGEALAGRTPPDLAGARVALEAAFELSPADSYLVDRLRALYERLGDRDAAIQMLSRALAAGGPRQVWGPELARLEGPAPLEHAHARAAGLERAAPVSGRQRRAARAPSQSARADEGARRSAAG